MTQPPPDEARIRGSIAEAVTRLGPRVRDSAPKGVVVAITAAALLPVAAALIAGGPFTAIGGLGALLGTAGQDLISDCLRRFRGSKGKSEDDLRGHLEEALAAKLDAQGAEAAALRTEVSALLQAVDGVDAALGAAADDLKDVLATKLSEVGATLGEFHWLLDEVRSTLRDIQSQQMVQIGLLRRQIQLQEEHMADVTRWMLERRPALDPEPDAEPDREAPADLPCPYKGLETFQLKDAAFFFGREALIASLSARLAEASLLVVVGASGSGKSSVVRAGLLAAVKRGVLPGSEGWPVILMTPGAQPLRELASCLSALRGVAAGSLLADLEADAANVDLAVRQIASPDDPRARLLLVVDQLEEVFTLCRDEHEREAFLRALVAAPAGGRALVVATLRSDFYGRFAAYPGLRGALEAHQALVPPLDEEELRRTIERPAQQAGLSLEEGLVDAIVRDVAGEPGALPLLSHALFETFKARRGRRLTLAGYTTSGGVREAIARTADSVVERLDERQREIARSLFLRLTELGNETEDTRRRVTRAELASRPEDAEAVDEVVNLLAAERLVTVSEDELEVAHEALIRHWPTLRRWLDEDREGLRLHRRVTEAAADWLGQDHDQALLLRGSRLAAALEWAERHDRQLNQLERDFLAESRTQQQSELERARRSARRARTLALALGLFLLAAAASAVFAYRESDRADARNRVATSLRLASQAVDQFDTRLDLGLLLSLEAYRAKPTAEARHSVVLGIERIPRVSGILAGGGDVLKGVAYAPDGHTLAAVGGTAVSVWNLDGRSPPRLLHHPQVSCAAFAPDGTLATAAADGTIRLWRDGKQVAAFGHGAAVPVTSLAFDSRGLLASGGADGTVRLWRDGRRIASLEHGFPVLSVAFGPSGELASAAADGTIQLWRNGLRAGPALRHTGSVPVSSVAFSPAGVLASGALDGTVRLWRDGVPLARSFRHSAAVLDVAWTGDGSLLAAAGNDGSIRVWTPRGHRLAALLRAGTTRVLGIAFSADGATLASAGGPAVILWSPRSFRGLSRLLDQRAGRAVAFAEDGTLATGGADGRIRLWRNGRAAGPPLRHGFPVTSVAWSHEGTLASGAADGSIRLWRGGRSVARLNHGFPVSSLAWSDGTLVSGAADGTLRLWRNGKPLGRPMTHGFPILSVAFGSEGLVASGAADGTVRLWRDGASVGKALRHGSAVLSVAFTRDGEILASADADGTIRLWEARRHGLLGQLVGHEAQVLSVAFSPTGRTLLSAGDNGSIILWDVLGQRKIGETLRDYGDSVASVAFGPDGAFAAAQSTGRVTLWDSLLATENLASLKDRFCRVVRRNLTEDEWRRFLAGESYRRTCVDA